METEQSEPYDDHQNYETYEEQFYEGAYWTGYDEHQRTPIESTQQSHDETTISQNETINVLFTTPAPSIECRNCRRTFTSGNKLHIHLRAGCKSANGSKPTKATKIIMDPNDVGPGSSSTHPDSTIPQRILPKDQDSETGSNIIVESDATESKTGGYGFRGWQYITAMIQLRPRGPVEAVCLDTGCTMSIIDREFLLKQVPKATIRRMASPITVRGVGQGTHSCNKFARLDLYLQGNPIALIHRDVHVVDGLKAKLLIGMDIIGPERIILDIPQRVAIIRSCKDTRVPITVSPRTSQRVKQPIKTSSDNTIPPHSHMIIPVQRPDLPNDRDLLFEPFDHSNGIAVYAHIVNCHLSAVQVRNDSESPITIRKDSPLGIVGEYEVDGCFAAHPDVALLVGTGNTPTETPIIRNVLAAATVASVNKETNDPNTPKTRLESGITIYGNDPTDFETVINSYPEL